MRSLSKAISRKAAVNTNTELPLLVVIAGPTAVGKTGLCTSLASDFETEIISADSRQFYRELKIGSAMPTREELAAVPHHFIGHLGIQDYYNVYRFEQDVIGLLDDLFSRKRIVFLTGGSGLYLHAVYYGIDELPDPDQALRAQLEDMHQCYGITSLQTELLALDPEYYTRVDLNNPVRLIRAIEVCRLTGQKYSTLRRTEPKPRNFRVLKIALNRDRDELLERIKARTEAMFAAGFVEEARELLPYRKLNPLNTVGYKEVFEYLDGNMSIEFCKEKVVINTRKYAKRQLTWLNRESDINWFHPDDPSIADLIHSSGF